jgi:hypothetical protein
MYHDLPSYGHVHEENLFDFTPQPVGRPAGAVKWSLAGLWHFSGHCGTPLELIYQVIEKSLFARQWT